MTVEELWRPIPGYSMYEASSYGRIRSWIKPGVRPITRAAKPRLLKTRHRSVKYPKTTLRRDDGRLVTVRVHRLVLVTHVSAPPDRDGWTASHLDGDPNNNHAQNLCWEAMKTNVGRQLLHGTRGPSNFGETHNCAKLTAAKVRAIRQAHAGGARQADLAREYGVSSGTMNCLIRRKTWKHVT